MRIQLTESFQKDVALLSAGERSHLFEVMIKLPVAVKTPRLHGGLGLRKIHPSGIFEARIGLGLRIVFAFEQSLLILHRVGTHDDIQRYLKTL